MLRQADQPRSRDPYQHEALLQHALSSVKPPQRRTTSTRIRAASRGRKARRLSTPICPGWGTLGAQSPGLHGSTADNPGKGLTRQEASCELAPQVRSLLVSRS
jgi:hypothetical protein